MSDIKDMETIKGQSHSPDLVKLINKKDDDSYDYSMGMCLD